MITGDEAVHLAIEHNRRRGLHPEPRGWLASGFDGGWLVMPEGDDLADRVGYAYLVILDDGRIYEEASTLPAQWTLGRYRSRHGRLMPPEEEARDRAQAMIEGRVPVGVGAWSGIRFAGGWLMRLVVDPDRPDADLAWVVALDDGTTSIEPVVGRLDAVITRYEISDPPV